MGSTASADEVPLFPAWKNAERVLLDRGLTFGVLVTDEELADLLAITPPKPTIADVQRFNLEKLEQVEALRASMLENHNMMLGRTLGLGYTVVPPSQQTSYAMRRRTHEVRNTLKKLAREVSHVALDRLTDAQRKENADAQSHLGSLATMVSKHLRRLE